MTFQPQSVPMEQDSFQEQEGARDFERFVKSLAGERCAGRFVLDIGGEGRHGGAWNLNPRTRRTLGPLRGQPIPRLIRGRGECIPLAAESVDLVIVERTPLRTGTLDEIRRVTKPGGWVLLRHALAPAGHPHLSACRRLAGTAHTSLVRLGRQDVLQTAIQIAAAASHRGPEKTTPAK